jgi:hypothetical protein
MNPLEDPERAPNFRTLDELEVWVRQCLSAGSTIAEVEETVRLYVLALCVQGRAEQEVDAAVTALGIPSETADWLVRTTPKRLRAEGGGSQSADLVVMGRPMGLSATQAGDITRERANDRTERRLREAKRLARGEGGPDPKLDFNEYRSYAMYRTDNMAHNVARRWFLIFAAVALLATVAFMVFWNWKIF